jgi:Cu/Zn superoxide dismutase
MGRKLMTRISRRGRWVTAAAVTTGTLAMAGLSLGAVATPSLAATIPGAHAGQQAAKQVSWVPLMPMPEGTVRLSHDSHGTVDATVSVTGLTPGSAHTVELVNTGGQVVAPLGTLTANGTGQATATVGSRHPVSAEPIAQTVRYDSGQRTYRLIPVEASADGTRYGTPWGWARISYDPDAQTIAVTVNAGGLTPGAHAAHIHVGSCAAQGAVKYMLMDFTASTGGWIVNQTRTVTNVTTPLPASGWYLNVHQGNGSNILDASGNPTINFRPLLCGDITGHG